MNNLNLNNSHNLIPREQNYRLSRKLLTVHANDRDIKYYPLSNEFSIKCPQAYTNVQSIRLKEISFPSPIFNISEKLNNDRFTIIHENSINYSIIIPNGFYTLEHFTQTLQNYIKIETGDNSYKVFLEIPKNKIIIGHPTKEFKLIPLNNNNCNNSSNFSNLLYEMGFDIPDSYEIVSLKDVTIYPYWEENIIDADDAKSYRCKPSNSTRFLDKQPIYMEIDKLNTYDELTPNPSGSNNLYNNYSNSSTNTAFIKLQPNYTTDTYDDSSVLHFLDPPITRFQNLKFKFRYHDGRLVDLGSQDVNFTLEINELHDEIPKQLNIRTPA